MTRYVRFIPALSLAVITAATLAAQDQPIGFKKCSAPKVPIGLVRGSGELRFDISAKGKPDTSTIRVLSATGISPAGLRSAVGRQLSACEFDTKKAHLTGVSTVRQAWSFEDMKTRFGGAIRSDTGTAMLLAAFTPPPAPIPDTAAILEERPRPLACKNIGPAPLLGPDPGASGSDPSSAPSSVTTTDLTATFEFIVDTAGRVVPGSVRTLQSSDLVQAEGMAKSYEGCRYVPGRMGGLPVQTIVDQKTVLQTMTTTTQSGGRGRRR